jgi:Ca-activated chloride channel family protein
VNTNVRWGLATLVSVGAAVAITWVVARNTQATPGQDPGRPGEAKKNNADSVKLVVAFSRPLAKYSTKSHPTVLTRILNEAELKTPGGKRIEIERLPMSSPEMLEGVMSGTLKADVLIPTSDVYLDLLDREWTLRTGKPMTSDRVIWMHQPYVLAVRRPMAEAMGWPEKDLGWADVVKIARSGWEAAGHPEWGSLKLLLLNPDFSDAGLHAVASVALGMQDKSKGLSSDYLGGPELTAAYKAIDKAVVWYPGTIDDFLRNESLAVPPRCDMTFLPEHLMLALNDHSARRKAKPDWVAIYPARGTIFDGVAGAVVQREWVTPEQREAAGVLLKRFKTPDLQKRIMAMGYRPALKEIALAAPLTPEMGIDPTRRETAEMPSVELLLECVSAWDKAWKARSAEGPEKGTPVASAKRVLAAPPSMMRHSRLTPTIQCVHRAKPSTVTIRHAGSNKVRGTGVIIDERGYAVTNNHVVGADKIVAINLLDSEDKIHEGVVVCRDPAKDLAIVRIKAKGKYRAVKYGNPSEREVGETVIAIGNPLGYTGTVTVGIISAMGRKIDIPTGYTLTELIQTSAPINPGNSGGPLLDVEGQLVGIVFAVRQEAQNIAFAIPVNQVRAYVKENLPR